MKKIRDSVAESIVLSKIPEGKCEVLDAQFLSFGGDNPNEEAFYARISTH